MKWLTLLVFCIDIVFVLGKTWGLPVVQVTIIGRLALLKWGSELIILTVGSKVHFKTITAVCCLGKFFIMSWKHCLQGLYFDDSMGNFTIISRCGSLCYHKFQYCWLDVIPFITCNGTLVDITIFIQTVFKQIRSTLYVAWNVAWGWRIFIKVTWNLKISSQFIKWSLTFLNLSMMLLLISCSWYHIFHSSWLVYWCFFRNLVFERAIDYHHMRVKDLWAFQWLLEQKKQKLSGSVADFCTICAVFLCGALSGHFLVWSIQSTFPLIAPYLHI